ncbi:MAG: RagB/SusD family nutrient uptake outer membrane protein [Cytophagales bacterium]|nr:MAG: RagB/SusD family nutrient uptake outer membrane protein [Cytophagales bacterium]
MKKVILYISLSLGVFFSSCDSLIDVQPRQSIDTATAFTSEEAVQAAILGVYDRLQGLRVYGRDLIALPEALSDNGRATNKSGRLNPEYLNQPGAHFADGLWQGAYYAINQINLILENLPTVPRMAQATKDVVEGEALFMRALFYFNLTRAYAYDPGAIVAPSNKGSVPLILKGVTGLDQVELSARASIDDVYAQIYKDLDGAIAKLPARTAVNRVNKVSAQAIYSRVALYRRDYAAVVKNANDALNGGVGSFLSNAAYVGGFRSAINPESIFELEYQTPENTGVNESLQTSFTTLLTSGNRATTGGFGDLVPTNDLLAQFETGDVRRNLYELGTAGRGAAEIECTKFLGKNGQPNLDNVPVIRVSEVILNRAEALAMQGNAAAALTDLNRIRTRAGLAESTASGTALLEEILKQRRVELAFEGHRWFDLKRLGRDIVKAAPAQTIPFTDFKILARLPIREIQINSNLQQNSGY